MILVMIPDELKDACEAPYGLTAEDVLALREAVKRGTPLPEPHGKIGDIDRLQKAFERNVAGAEAYIDLFNAAPPLIPATEEEKSCENCEHGFLSIAPPYCCRLDWKERANCIESMKHWAPKQTTTKEEKSCEDCENECFRDRYLPYGNPRESCDDGSHFIAKQPERVNRESTEFVQLC